VVYRGGAESAGSACVAAQPLPALALLLGAALVLDPSLQAHAESGAAALSLDEVLRASAQQALKGGAAGFAAGALQVVVFMWLRTAMNVQYANGGTLSGALQKLWAEGGVRRLYQGVSIAIVQAPLARFGDTAANTGVLALLAVTAPDVPLALATAAASTAGACWRLLLTPLDTLKTARQVRGATAVALLAEKTAARGPLALYDGALAAAGASWVGSYPWFVTFNALQASLPAAEGPLGLARKCVRPPRLAAAGCV
jgi:hypothetical protein